jgi:hypothetical protein
MKKIALLILIMVSINSSAQNKAQNVLKRKDEMQIIKLMAEIDKAHIKGDTAAFDRIWASEYTLIDWRGAIKNRAQAMAEWVAGQHKYESYQSDSIKVRFYGNTAIVTAHIIRKSKTDPQNFGQFRHTRVFVKIKHDWKLVTTHVTQIVQ